MIERFLEMNVRNCKNCGLLFKTTRKETLCLKCVEEELEAYKIVREYVYDNPEALIMEVVEATRTTKAKILQYVREGRLILIGSKLIDCGRCGIGILTGKYCKPCATQVEKEFGSIGEIKENSFNGGFHGSN